MICFVDRPCVFAEASNGIIVIAFAPVTNAINVPNVDGPKPKTAHNSPLH